MIGQAAAAAVLLTSQPCYVEGAGRVAFTGSGFAPGSRVEIELDGRRVGAVPASPAGMVQGGRIPAPSARGGQRTHRLSASDPVGNAADARFRTTVVRAEMFPANPAGTRVRFRLRGFPSPAGRPVRLHYVRPGGRRAQRTVSLGPARPPCGALLTRPRPLFGFRASPGIWTLRFDLQPRWSRRSRPPTAAIGLPVIRR